MRGQRVSSGEHDDRGAASSSRASRSAPRASWWNQLLRRHPTLAPLIVLSVITIASLAPFANKAFHIDDPIFLWPARQVLRDPSRPLDASVNWYGVAEPLVRVTNHAPLTSYFLAVPAAIFGISEIPLHLAMILPAIGAVFGTCVLARGLTHRRMLAAVMLLVTTGFLVSATSVMSDVPMLCLWVWSIVLWRHAAEVDGRAPLLYLVAGATLAAAVLCKFPAVQVVPLLALTSIRRRHWPVQVVALALPVLAIVGYQLLSRHWYGQGMFGVAAGYAAANWRDNLRALPARLTVGFAFVGGCALAPALVLLSVASVRTMVIAGASAVAAFVLVKLWPSLMPLWPLTEVRRPYLLPQFVLLATAGAALVVATLTQLWRHSRGRDASLLALWVIGVLIFAAVVNWTVNVRTVLPLTPALCIVTARAIDRPLLSQRRLIMSTAPALVIAAAVTIIVAIADYRLAGASRQAASMIHARARQIHGTVWFMGHWGFQWYMESLGARPFDLDSTDSPPGDLIVVPSNNTNPYPLPPGSVQRIDVIVIRPFPWLSTMNGLAGAGFYSDRAGPLPYAFGPAPPERFTVYRVLHGFSQRPESASTTQGAP